MIKIWYFCFFFEFVGFSSSGIGLKRIPTNSIPDVALGRSNRNSPATSAAAATHSVLGRNGGNFNRGIEFLRNAFFGQGGNNIGGDTKEYRKLNASIQQNYEPQRNQQPPHFVQQLQQQQKRQQPQQQNTEQYQYEVMQHQSMPTIGDNSSTPKKLQMGNGFVAVQKNNAHLAKDPPENTNQSSAYKQKYELTLC